MALAGKSEKQGLIKNKESGKYKDKCKQTFNNMKITNSNGKGHSPHKISLPSDTNCKTTLKFDNCLEVF